MATKMMEPVNWNHLTLLLTHLGLSHILPMELLQIWLLYFCMEATSFLSKE